MSVKCIGSLNSITDCLSPSIKYARLYADPFPSPTKCSAPT